MSWTSSMSPELPGNDCYISPEVERLARQLADDAGRSWDSMSHYPGFERNQWRDKAERLLRARDVLDQDGPPPIRFGA